MPTLRAGQGGERNGFIDPERTLDRCARRLTMFETERLQGFPDGYTQPPGESGDSNDAQRRKAVGNSFAVPVVRWIGRRIQMYEEITNGKDAA